MRTLFLSCSEPISKTGFQPVMHNYEITRLNDWHSVSFHPGDVVVLCGRCWIDSAGLESTWGRFVRVNPLIRFVLVGANLPGFADINPFDRPRLDHESSGASLTLNWDIGATTLTSVTGYDKMERVSQGDWDGTPLPTNDYSFDSDINSVSQELRLASNGDGPVTWVVGAYFAEDEVKEKVRYDCTNSDICLGLAYGVNYIQEASTAAVFAHTEWFMTDSLSLVLGLRYTEEERTFSDAATTVDADPFFVA